MNTECVELLPADTVISEQINAAPPVHILIPDAIKNSICFPLLKVIMNLLSLF